MAINLHLCLKQYGYVKKKKIHPSLFNLLFIYLMYLNVLYVPSLLCKAPCKLKLIVPPLFPQSNDNWAKKDDTDMIGWI